MTSSKPKPRLPLIDRFSARGAQLPQPGPYAKERLRIPLRDGVELAADLLTPADAVYGTLLTMGPYGRGALQSSSMASLYASRGYRVLYVSSRGTFGSGGQFDPMRTEASDIQDVVAWMRVQPWFDGSFATVGTSYLGHTQWALLEDPPAELRASVIHVGPHDFSAHAWGTGTLNLDFIGWTDLIDTQERPTIAAIIARATTSLRLRPVLNGTPILDAAEKYFGGRRPWLRERLTRPDISDEYWTPTNHTAALEKVTTPVLIITGWQDIFAVQSHAQYRRLRERGVDTAITVGAWTHVPVGGDAGARVPEAAIGWLEEKLGGARTPARRDRAHIYVTGSGDWRWMPEWPPATSSLVLHPRMDLTLSPMPGEGEVSFIYDPTNPTPTIGGPLLAPGTGIADDSRLAMRDDVLAFTGEPLAADLEIMGTPVLELGHRSERGDADLFVRISDVDERGRSHNVTEGYARTRDADGAVRITLRPLAHRFVAGHRIRLLVAGGSFPQFPRNPGTGENPVIATDRFSDRHVIDLGISRLDLPISEEATP